MSARPERLVHHELCFGCGRANLFGLLAELERGPDGSVRGRAFVKQDHQGPSAGSAHPGVVAAALLEALDLLCGAPAAALSIEFSGSAPVGEFLELEAAPGEAPSEALAEARIAGRLVATARARTAADA